MIIDSILKQCEQFYGTAKKHAQARDKDATRDCLFTIIDCLTLIRDAATSRDTREMYNEKIKNILNLAKLIRLEGFTPRVLGIFNLPLYNGDFLDNTIKNTPDSIDVGDKLQESIMGSNNDDTANKDEAPAEPNNKPDPNDAPAPASPFIKPAKQTKKPSSKKSTPKITLDNPDALDQMIADVIEENAGKGKGKKKE
jgi:hypothetical protein